MLRSVLVQGGDNALSSPTCFVAMPRQLGPCGRYSLPAPANIIEFRVRHSCDGSRLQPAHADVKERERVYFPHTNNTWTSTLQKYKIRRVARKALGPSKLATHKGAIFNHRRVFRAGFLSRPIHTVCLNCLFKHELPQIGSFVRIWKKSSYFGHFPGITVRGMTHVVMEKCEVDGSRKGCGKEAKN